MKNKKPEAKKVRKINAKPKTKKQLEKKDKITKAPAIISPELKEELAKANIITRGRIFVGTVVSSKANKTVRVEWQRKKYLPKYERFEKRRTRVQAHNPDCLSVKEGDKVRISECRSISKMKKFVVIEKMEGKQ